MTEKISIAPHVVGCLLDIALVVDCSGSIRESNPEGVDNWQYVLNFVVNTVTSLNIEKTATHVGVVTFGTQLKPCCLFLVAATARFTCHVNFIKLYLVDGMLHTSRWFRMR